MQQWAESNQGTLMFLSILLGIDFMHDNVSKKFKIFLVLVYNYCKYEILTEYHTVVSLFSEVNYEAVAKISGSFYI